jgi:UDPglucose 6-dehydrogenase
MKITVIGSGYVGLVSAACFADQGNDVIGIDIDEEKVNKLNEGIIPIYEPGLKEIIQRTLKLKTLSFTTDIKKGIEESDIIMLAVGTPMGEDHRADLSAVKKVGEEIGKYINGYKVIITKSTVPVGTNAELEKIIKLNQLNQLNQSNQSKKIDFDVVSNPEFLQEGKAVYNFKNPDRIIVGTKSQKAREIMKDLYSGIIRSQSPIFFTNRSSAEIIKYVSNAMLATRISFMNSISELCEKTGGDIKEVSYGTGLDKRIGPKFLHAGIGYGGSCFPKDVQALIKTMQDHNCNPEILESVENVNRYQKENLIKKLKELVPNLTNKKIAVLGLAFKPKTDDIREAPALTLIKGLQKQGALINACDPEAMQNTKEFLGNTTINYFENPYDSIKNADAIVICTEWDSFRNLDKKKIYSLMNEPNVIDGRNIYDPKEMKELGFKYLGIGRE